MRTTVIRLALMGVSLAAVGLGAAQAQTASPDSPAALVLPPLPDVKVNIDASRLDRSPVATTAPAQTPAAEPTLVPAAPTQTVETATPDLAPSPPAATAEPVQAAQTPPADAAPAASQSPAETANVSPSPAASASTPPAPDSAPSQSAPATIATAPDVDLAAPIQALVQEPAPSGLTVAARHERDAVAAFYAARNYAPVWFVSGAWTKAARAALGRLQHAADDALDLRETPLPVLTATDAQTRAAADVALSRAIVNYGREASGSRVDPRSISRLITEKPEVAQPADILASVSAADDADAALRGFNPPQEGYAALRAKLVELRREKPQAPERISTGPTLKVGMSDMRVPLIRARLGLSAQAAPETSDGLLYDTRVASAIADFQRANGLPASGQLTPRTVAVLSGGEPAQLEAEIVANMERWRWLPRTVEPDEIAVNIPDFTVTVKRDGVLVHTARVIVGKPDTPTPVFSNRMQFIEVNPYWNVPDSIIKKEMLPKLAKDPTYLQRMGYEVKTVNGRMTVRQPPGERNALGRIKFMFPNEHAVYLHDTPTRGLFVNARRAYSHGCVRVDDPFKFAEIVLGKDSGWSEDRVKKLIGGANRVIRLPKQIDIHIEYFTAFVDPDGKLQLRDDIYGYSRKLKAALGLNA